MRYAQTIAMATDLLASGRADDVVRMVEPLLKEISVPNDLDDLQDTADEGAVRLQCITASIDIVHYGRPDRALRRLAPYESVHSSSQPSDALSPTARADTALWLGWAHAFQRTSADEEARALSLFDEALSIYANHHNIRGRCWTRLGQARAYFALDEYHLMRRALDEADSLLGTIEDELATCWLHELRVPALRFEGRYDEARHHIDALQDMGTQWDSQRIRGHATAYRAALRYDRGAPPDDVREAASAAQTMLTPVSPVSQYPLLAAHHAHVGACLRSGCLDEATSVIDEAAESVETYPVGAAHLQTLRARVALHRGDAEKAERLLERLFEQAHHLPHGLHRSHVALLRAELLRLRGETEEADTWVQRALRNARETGHRGHQLRSLCARAALLVQLDRYPEAQQVIDATLAYSDYDTVLPYVVLRAMAEGDVAVASGQTMDARIAFSMARSAASITQDATAQERATVRLAALDETGTATAERAHVSEPASAYTPESDATDRQADDSINVESVLGALLAHASRSAPLVAEAWIQTVKPLFPDRWIGMYERRPSGELRRLHASGTDPETLPDPALPHEPTQELSATVHWHPLTGTRTTYCFFGIESLPAQASNKPAMTQDMTQEPDAEYRTDGTAKDPAAANPAAANSTAEDLAAEDPTAEDPTTSESAGWGRQSGHGSTRPSYSGSDPALERIRPWLPVVALAIERAQERARANHLNDLQAASAVPVDGFIAESAAMQGVAQQIRRIQTSHSPVLLSGERGTERSLVARAIHETSGRAQAPCVAVSCSTMQRNPIEANLFGDARNATFEPGAFQSADGGTVILEDVDALPKSAQDRLIQAIESGDVLPVGATTPVPADVRALATTCTDLQKEIREGRFREDLFLHLNVIPIRIPPLRNRREDIPLLVRHFAKTLRPAGTPLVSVTHRAMEAMLSYDWPGNVRQLRNEMERLLLLVHTEPAPMIDEPLLADPIREAEVSDSASEASTSGGSARPHPPAPGGPGMDAVLQPDTSLTDVLAETESAVIRRVLDACDGQITASADVLGLTRQGLYKKMKRLNIDASNFQKQPASA